MKIALLGNGKSGSEVLKAHKNTLAFNTTNRPTLKAIIDTDVVISFLPGDALKNYFDILLKSKKPVIIASTGLTWGEELKKQISEYQTTWVWAHNFSLSMAVLKDIIRDMQKLKHFCDNGEFFIHETHHTSKKDAPSGTALSWNSWLGNMAQVSYERKGDINGYHKLTFKNTDEEITLTHKANNRSLFAKGALKAAEILYNNPETRPIGLISFDQLLKSL